MSNDIDNVPQEFLDELKEHMSTTDVSSTVETLLTNMAEEYRKGNFKEVHRYALLSSYDNEGKMVEEPSCHEIDGFSVETIPEEKRIVLTQTEFFKITEKELVDNLEPLKQSRDTFIASIAGTDGDDPSIIKKEVRGFISRLLLGARSDRAAQVSLYLMLENPDVFDIENEILTCGTDIYPILVSRDCFIYHHPTMKNEVKVFEEALVFDYEISEDGDITTPGFEEEGRTITVTYSFQHTLLEDTREKEYRGDEPVDIVFSEDNGNFVPGFNEESRYNEITDDIKSLAFLTDTKLDFVRNWNVAKFSSGSSKSTIANIYYTKELDELGLKFVDVYLTTEKVLKHAYIDSYDFEGKPFISNANTGISLINHCVSGHISEDSINYEIEADVKFVKGKGTHRNYSAFKFVENVCDSIKTQVVHYSLSTLLSDVDGTVIKDCLMSRFIVSIGL